MGGDVLYKAAPTLSFPVQRFSIAFGFPNPSKA